jgi:hypothetical protein
MSLYLLSADRDDASVSTSARNAVVVTISGLPWAVFEAPFPHEATPVRDTEQRPCQVGGGAKGQPPTRQSAASTRPMLG